MFTGIIIGGGTFLIIGAFHPLVIKGEYHFGVRVWWAFLAAGLAALTGSLLVEGIVASALLGITGFTCLWGIGEVFHQRRRVEKGWFPKKVKSEK